MDIAVFNKKEKIMNKKTTGTDILMFAIMAIPAIYLGFNYASLPATIPVHFNFHGPDGYAEKAQSWVIVAMMSLLSLGLYIFLKYLPSIDPKRTAAASASLVFKISMIIVVFFMFFQIIIINAMKGNMFSIEKMLIPTLGIFFALLGNLMLNIKPNYFVGIRLPWTLENEDNWRATHRLAGKLWFAGGIIAAILGILLPYQYAFISFMIVVFTVTITPIVFSYRYFKTNKQP